MSAITEVVRIDEIDACIERVGLKVRAGLLKLIDQGIGVEYPKSLDFQMTVLVEFEALTSTSGELATVTEIQGGFSTETQSTNASDLQESSESRTTNGKHVHVGSDKETITQSQQ